LQTKAGVYLIKQIGRLGKRAISIFLTIIFILTNIFPVFTFPFLFSPQKAYAAADVPLSLKLDNFNDVSLLQLNGHSATALYNTENILRLTPAVVGAKSSTYTKKPISLANERSFSTYFKFRMGGRWRRWFYLYPADRRKYRLRDV